MSSRLTSSTSELRRANRSAVLRALDRCHSMSRLELSVSTGLTGAAISRITRELIDSGLVAEQRVPVSLSVKAVRGRQTRRLALAPNGAWLIVMVFSANRRIVGLARSTGEIPFSIELSEVSLAHPEKALTSYLDAAEELINRHAIESTRIVGISVIVAAPTRPDQDGHVSSDTLGWRNVPLQSLLRQRTSCPIHIETRAHALLQSEIWQRSATPIASAMIINNGWRIGSGVIIDGAILESSHASLGQIAHLASAVTSKGKPERCYCGRYGCLDAVASGEAIVLRILQKFPNAMEDDIPAVNKLEQAIQMAENDRYCQMVFTHAGRVLGQSLATVQILFAPQRIFIAGNIGREPHFIAGVQAGLKHNASAADTTLTICSISSVEAAVRSGLNALLFSERFSFESLRGHRQQA